MCIQKNSKSRRQCGSKTMFSMSALLQDLRKITVVAAISFLYLKMTKKAV